MSMIITPCEEEPPEPDEQPGYIVAPRESGKTSILPHCHPLFILQCEVKIQTFSKLKSRAGCSSSLLSINVVYNDGYIPLRLSIVWNKTLNFLEYSPLSRGLPNNAIFDVAQTTLISLSDPVNSIGNHELENIPTGIVSEVNSLGEKTLRIPTIIITPPETSDDAVDITCNAIPTPQDSALGFYLTVPDFDSNVAHNWHGYEGHRITTDKRFDVLMNHGSSSNDDAQPKFDATVSRRNCVMFDHDGDEEVVDLGPTWCG